MFATANLAPHQAGRFEHADMARHAGERHGQRSGQVGDPGITLTQGLQQASSGRIGERAVCAIQQLIFNHLVDYNRDL